MWCLWGQFGQKKTLSFLNIECVSVRKHGVFEMNNYDNPVRSFGLKVRRYKLQYISKRSVEDMSIKQGCFKCSKCQSHTIILFICACMKPFWRVLKSFSRATCQYCIFALLRWSTFNCQDFKHFISQNHYFLSDYFTHCYSQWMINVSYFLFCPGKFPEEK